MNHDSDIVKLQDMKTFIGLVVGFFFVGCVYAQTCEDLIVPSTPDVRFQDNGDGTVTDLYHGLVWKRCVEGLSGTDCSNGVAAAFNWQEALLSVESINAAGGYAGYTDWRLPNIKELASLVEVQCISPAINKTVFPASQSDTLSLDHWSSTHHVHWMDDSWVVNFDVGSVYHKSRQSTALVRLVRGP